MNVVNRLVTVLLAVLLWAVVVVVAAAPQQALAWARQGLDRVELWLAELASLQPAWIYPLLRGAAIIVLTLLVAAFVMQELRRRRVPVVKVRVPSGGEAAVTTEAVGRRLAWHIDQLADVVSVTPVVRTRGHAVDVELHLETAPDVDVPMKTEEVVAVARDVIETQMGLQLNRVKVKIEHTPYQPAL